MKLIRVLVLGVATLAAADTVWAQAGTASNGISVGVGYQILHIPDETFPAGLNFDVAVPVAGHLRAVGEFGFVTDDQTEPGVSGNLKFYNLGGGPRWTLRRAPLGQKWAALPFAQVLVGAVRTDADLRLNGVAFNDADWAFMIQPGAGVSVPLTPTIGILGQVDYRRSFFTTAENEFRFVFGVRVNGR